MTPLWIMEHGDMLEYRAFCLAASVPTVAPDQFCLDGFKGGGIGTQSEGSGFANTRLWNFDRISLPLLDILASSRGPADDAQGLQARNTARYTTETTSVPRARAVDDTGETTELRSKALPR